MSNQNDTHFLLSDGGKEFSLHADDRNCCVVVAFAHLAQVPYDLAWTALDDAGRKHKRGCNTPKIALKVSDALGIELQPIQGVSVVKDLIERYPKGSLLVRVARHAFCIRDGVILDRCKQGLQKHVRNAWLLV